MSTLTDWEPKTQIEAMCERELMREPVAGVIHFVPGQLQVRRLEVLAAPDTYELSVVDAMGNAWLILYDHDDVNGWSAIVAFRGGQTSCTMAPAPQSMRPGWESALDRCLASP